MDNVQAPIRVGISDLNIVFVPHTIRTAGLGSCVGVVVYDLPREIAGMSHVMLPNSELAKQTNLNKYKYANTAIPILLDKLLQNGARKHALKAKLAGGAQMFQFASSSDIMRIGPRNVEAIKEQLSNYRIPIVSIDVGGNCGRTIEFNPKSGELKIRTVNKGEKVI